MVDIITKRSVNVLGVPIGAVVIKEDTTATKKDIVAELEKEEAKEKGEAPKKDEKLETEPGTWEPRIIDTTFNQRHIALLLIEYAKEFGTITDRYYKYSRTGSGPQDTNYTLIPLDQSPMPDSIKSMPLHDLNTVYMTLPYAKQEKFFTTGEIEKEGW